MGVKTHRTVILAGISAFLLASVLHAQVPKPTKELEAIWSKAPRPVLPVTRCATAPTIDGKLDDAAWAEAAAASEFIRVKGIRGNALWGVDAPEAGTSVKICYDDEFLYLGWRCEEPFVEVLKTQTKVHDGSVWFDDCVEFFLDVTRDGKHVIQTITSAANVVYDADYANGGKKWSLEGAQSVVSKGDKVWFVEAAYPFAGLGVQAPKAGDTWRMNFGRERYASSYRGLQENSLWSGQPESKFDMPERFGDILFGDLALVSVSVPRAFIGTAKVEARIRNTSAKARKLAATLECTSGGDLGGDREVELPAGQVTTVEIPFSTKTEGTQILWLTLKEGEKVVAVARRTFYVPSVSDPLAKTIGKMEGLLTNAKEGSELAAGIEEQLPKMRELQQQVAAFLEKQAEQPISDEAKKTWDGYEKRMKSFAALGTYVIWKKSPWLAVDQKELPESLNDRPTVSLTAAQGELEAFCFVFSNLTSEPIGLRLMGRLPIPGKLYSSPITTFEEIARENPDSAHLKGSFADPERIAGGDPTSAVPLLRMNEWNELWLPANQTRQVWGLLDTHGVEPGKYSKSLVVKHLNKPWPDKRLSISITVWDFAIPEKTPLGLYLWDYASSEAHIKDMADHRVNIFFANCNVDHLKKSEEVIKRKLRYGQVWGGYGILHEFEKVAEKKGAKRGTGDYQKLFADYLNEWVNTMLSFGATYDQIAVQHFDEPYGDAIKKIVELGPVFRKEQPKLRLILSGMTPFNEVQEIEPYTDIFGFRGAYYYEPFKTYYQKLQAEKGKEVLTFTCSTPVMEMPPLSYWRVRPWLCRLQKMDGLMIFAWAYLVHWEWGQNADVVPPPTRGWEAVRQGMEDYCLLDLIEKEAGRVKDRDAGLAAEAKGLLEDALKNVAVAPRGPVTEEVLAGRLEEYRTKIGEMIVELRKVR